MTRCFSAAAELLVNPHIALRFLRTFIKVRIFIYRRLRGDQNSIV